MIPTNFVDLWSSIRERQNQAFFDLLAVTEAPAPWAYAVWDEVLANLRHKDNHNRAIAAQLLCGLAKSDPEQRLLRDFPALYQVTYDDRFVTARHCLQSLWKVALAGREQQAMVVNALQERFATCAAEKNCTLIRFDISQNLQRIYAATGDEQVRAVALALIETEPDLKYRKKYAGLWRSK